jgi:hypothetical protein
MPSPRTVAHALCKGQEALAVSTNPGGWSGGPLVSIDRHKTAVSKQPVSVPTPSTVPGRCGVPKEAL